MNIYCMNEWVYSLVVKIRYKFLCEMFNNNKVFKLYFNVII